MATYSSILAWIIAWTEETGGLLSTVGYYITFYNKLISS